MSGAQNYFDNAATTPLDPQVLDAMLPFLRESFGNPNSLHTSGLEAREAVETARHHVSGLVVSPSDEMLFTSGASESNNWVLQSFHDVVVSPLEHSSVFETARAVDFRTLDADMWSLESPEDCELVSVMTVSNETGAIIEPPTGLPPATFLHRDVTQSVGKLQIDLKDIDFASMSAHKLYGPKGIGALYIKNAVHLEPLLYGGEQEGGQRAGTLNVPAIVGFGKACELALERKAADLDHVQSLREVLVGTLAKVPDSRLIEGDTNSPYIASVSFLGIEGEPLVVEADNRGFAVSSGAACSSRSTEPSHVLTDLGLEPEWIRGVVRVSLSRHNTLESLDKLIKVLTESVENLRSQGK